jgi:DNA-binding SARP family transcriptional activator/TolB-like protein
MTKLCTVTLHLLGSFAIEVDVGRVIPISVRGKKPQALLAYLAMRPDFQAKREELATLFWGDNPDMLARHSLRQCLNSVRGDLCAASEILLVDREVIGLRASLLRVDALAFTSLAAAGRAEDLVEAAALWRGSFLADLVLDTEEFDMWRGREADRLAGTAAGVFDTLCRNAEASGDGEAAIAAAERAIGLDPTREDRQRRALALLARYRGRDVALTRAKSLVDLLRNELDVAPEPATRSLIEEVKRGAFARTPPREAPAPAVQNVVRPATGSISALESPPVVHAPSDPESAPESAPSPEPLAAAAVPAPAGDRPPPPPFWRRLHPAGIWAGMGVLAIAIVGALTFAYGSKSPRLAGAPQLNQGVVVLPFGFDNPARSEDATFARALTHGMIGYLSRFAGLRVISEPTSEFYRDRPFEPSLIAELGVRYAVVGHVSGQDNGRRIDIELMDTASRTNVWSDNLQRVPDDTAPSADDAARGMARMVSIEINRLATLRTRDKVRAELTTRELVARGYWALQRGNTQENLAAALSWFNEALQREPHNEAALLAVARVQVSGTMNFIDFGPPPDLAATERVLNEALRKYPNSISALYSLALLHKHRRDYEASLRLLQRCLEINPSFLSAQGQMGDVLTRLGQPERGLEQILQTIHAATPNDPGLGYWYLFAAEAELELGHDQEALAWALRADTFMPGSPLVEVWLASIYATVGDKPNAAKYVAALTKAAPERMRAFLERQPGVPDPNWHGLKIFKGLRLALSQ